MALARVAASRVRALATSMDSGLIAKLPSALQVDTEAVQKAELDEVWGPAGKLERGRLVGETAPTTRGKRQERGGAAARQARHEGDFLSRRSGR